MNTTVNDLYNYIDTFAPFDKHWSRDNVGILVGSKEAVCNKVEMSLDITCDVVKQAYKDGAQLIISHHPVIFNPIRVLNETHPAYWLARYGIAAICAHTNLDVSIGGVNDVLLKKCGVSKKGDILFDDENLTLGRMGTLDNIYDFNEYCCFLKKSLSCEVIRYSSCGKNIHKIAVIGGSGADCMKTALQHGCDSMITGEAKYNDFIDAYEMGINLIEAGHFCTENPIITILYDKLSEKFKDIEFILAKHVDPVKII